MSEQQHREAIRRAAEAAHVIEHPLVVEALAAMRATYYSNLEATKPSQKDEREFIYQQIQALNGFEAQFQFHIENGRMATTFLDRIRAEKVAKGRRR